MIGADKFEEALESKHVLFVVSTFGAGGPPLMAEQFTDWIEDRLLQKDMNDNDSIKSLLSGVDKVLSRTGSRTKVVRRMSSVKSVFGEQLSNLR